jgi:hypothetical protein
VADTVLSPLGVEDSMPPRDSPTENGSEVEVEIAFDERLLSRLDRHRLLEGYASRSDAVAAAIEAASE